MKLQLVGVALGLLLSFTDAQTFTDCNPMQVSCPPNPALGKSASFDFTQGYSIQFQETGSPTYDSNGAGFTVAKQGDAPLIQSKWYIMFGRVEFVIKAAPGKGIVSSAVLQSDTLDEIDWEWLGGNNALVQSNYFGKGNTDSFNRGATHDNPGNHDDFHTYTIDWSSKQIVWEIDGKVVRVLTPETAQTNQYPQSPMMVRVGVWAGGDPDNPQGTIDWAGGLTDYNAGPYTMYLKSIKVQDYSTGSTYSYGDKSGSWESINAEGGEVNGNIDADTISTVESTPTVTATVDNIPIPFDGTHRETASFSTPNIYPWVPRPTTLTTSADTGLPSGWTFSSSGQVQPPSAASSTFRYTSPSWPSSLASPCPSGTERGSSTPAPTVTPPVTTFHTTTTDKSATISTNSFTMTSAKDHSTTTNASDQSATTIATKTSAIATTTDRSITTTGVSGSDAEATPTSPSTTVQAAPNVDAAHRNSDVPIEMSALCFLALVLVLL